MPWLVLVMGGGRPKAWFCAQSDALETSLMPWSRPLAWDQRRPAVALLAACRSDTSTGMGWPWWGRKE